MHKLLKPYYVFFALAVVFVVLVSPVWKIVIGDTAVNCGLTDSPGGYGIPPSMPAIPGGHYVPPHYEPAFPCIGNTASDQLFYDAAAWAHDILFLLASLYIIYAFFRSLILSMRAGRLFYRSADFWIGIVALIVLATGLTYLYRELLTISRGYLPQPDLWLSWDGGTNIPALFINWPGV